MSVPDSQLETVDKGSSDLATNSTRVSRKMSRSRRDFVKHIGLASSLPLLGNAGVTLAAGSSQPQGKADSCIFIWLGGGACHIDTWDPKRRGNAESKTPGSYYDSIPTAVRDIQVCAHLHRTAELLDRCALLRSVHHNVVDEHAAAVNRLHTGRPTSGTTIYPSIGSVVAHQLGPGAEAVPSYVVMGYPNLTRGPGFLGPEAGFVYLTDTNAGPAGLQLPPDVDAFRQMRREKLLGKLQKKFVTDHRNAEKVESYVKVAEAGRRLTASKFMSIFDLHDEPTSRREEYGQEFGQRCLLARRLTGIGVRFVEVAFNLNFLNGTGWDTHNEGQLQQHLMIDELDRAFASLLRDLERERRLDRTLLVIATEFGRPPEFDGRGGRGHQCRAFSIVLAGGGLRTGRAVGETDELGKKIVDHPISVADLHATIYAAMGIDPAEELFDGDRPVPITDHGKPVTELLA